MHAFDTIHKGLTGHWGERGAGAETEAEPEAEACECECQHANVSEKLSELR